MEINPYHLENLRDYNQAYDRIEYLAERVQNVRKTLIIDDWALKYYTKKWMHETFSSTS